MAAAQRGRKKAQTQRRQHYRRKSQAKQRKSEDKQRRQARRKPVGKHGKSPRGKKPSPTPHNAKMLRRLQRDNRRLSNKAKGLMISFINDIYKKVSTQAEQLRKLSHRPTIGPLQVQAALQQVMPRKRVRRSVTPVSKRSH
ncbi:histone H2B.3-like [Trachemys scripta elegans]|uniref:histone H2B.3-like n=1 Tax=Trachemys scripta elegans TaxID=31138 RepID=UPI0015572135|nr:histone H2B.3-like [Trachemys scripta elegans]